MAHNERCGDLCALHFLHGGALFQPNQGRGVHIVAIRQLSAQPCLQPMVEHAAANDDPSHDSCMTSAFDLPGGR